MSALRAELRNVDLQHIVDECIADIMIQGVSREQALQQRALQAQMTLPIFRQYVMTRIEILLRR